MKNVIITFLSAAALSGLAHANPGDVIGWGPKDTSQAHRGHTAIMTHNFPGMGDKVLLVNGQTHTSPSGVTSQAHAYERSDFVAAKGRRYWGQRWLEGARNPMYSPSFYSTKVFLEAWSNYSIGTIGTAADTYLPSYVQVGGEPEVGRYYQQSRHPIYDSNNEIVGYFPKYHYTALASKVTFVRQPLVKYCATNKKCPNGQMTSWNLFQQLVNE
ncbi:hypothetical protein KUW19_16305 [Ferrimonas balearica]|uniref:hypothetical protein n=1 Tax=Ferrimonas balearica TaxID=44012 RepID=UPI001C98C14B|nr:hypothetical protein [Ferrimonas balearica]MBY6108024.1 hypothetical protein [Ferrimonas balearica]